MKFTVQGRELLNQLNASAKVLNSKNTIGILDNFLLVLKGNELSITCSDSENVLTSRVEVFDAEGEGSVALPAKRLLEIIKEIANQPITFVIGDDFSISVEYLNGNFSFAGIDASSYPLPAPLDPNATTISVPANVVRKGLGATLFAVATEQVRPIMTGVYWDMYEDRIVFASSDTHKLVKYENNTFQPGSEMNFTLHSKTCAVVNSILSAEDNVVEITNDGKSAIFNFGTYTLNCRFLKGKFPNYERVIPKDNPYKIVIDRQLLLSAIRRVNVFSSKASHLVRFGINDGRINLAAQDLDYSVSAKESVSCDYDGTPLVLGFHGLNTQEVLNNLPGENIVLEVSDPARPSLFLPFEKQEGETLVVLLMPLQVVD